MSICTSLAVRRAYPRMEVQVPIWIESADDDEPISGLTLNLSRSGALVRLQRPVVIGARYLIRILAAQPLCQPHSTACRRCGAVPVPDVLPEQSRWAVALRQSAGANTYAAAFEFEALLDLFEERQKAA